MMALIHHLDLEGVHLLGWSAGAIIGLKMAMEDPGCFASLTLLSGTFNREGFVPEFLEWQENATPSSLGKVATEIYRRNSPDGPDHLEEVFEKIRDQSHTHPNYSADDLKGQGVPSLLLSGDRDIVKLEHTLDMFLSMPDAIPGIIPGTGHRFLMERPDLVNDIIKDFLEGQEQG
jgi:pimeloyl-ACP methyl ester carboxylesterase